jgi:hypothetical protein
MQQIDWVELGNVLMVAGVVGFLLILWAMKETKPRRWCVKYCEYCDQDEQVFEPDRQFCICCEQYIVKEAETA